MSGLVVQLQEAEGRAARAKQEETQVRESHTLFFDTITAELMHRWSNDALANYLQVHPGDVLINMEDLEALAATLT